MTLNSLRLTACSSSPCVCGPQPERMGVHTGLQSLQVQVYPCSIPGALRRNSLYHSTHRTSRTQTELGWLASTACSCLLAQGRVGSCTAWLITKAIIQVMRLPYQALNIFQWMPKQLFGDSNRFLFSCTMIPWKLCREPQLECKDSGCLSAVLVSSLAEVAHAFQAVHWSHGTVSDPLGTRRQCKPRGNFNIFTDLTSLLALKKMVIYYTFYIYIYLSLKTVSADKLQFLKCCLWKRRNWFLNVINTSLSSCDTSLVSIIAAIWMRGSGRGWLQPAPIRAAAAKSCQQS